MLILSPFSTRPCARLWAEPVSTVTPDPPQTVHLVPSPSFVPARLLSLLDRRALQDAVAHLQTRDFQRAAESFEKAKAHTPAKSLERARALLGWAESLRALHESDNWWGKGYPRQIKEAFQLTLQEAEAAGDKEAAAAACYRLGLYWYSVNHFDDARLCFRQVVDKYPDAQFASDALVQLGISYADFYQANKDERTARKYFLQTLQRYPGTVAAVRAYYELGMQAVRKWDDGEAIANFVKAINAANASKGAVNLRQDLEAQDIAADAYYEMGLAYGRQKDFKSARETFQQLAKEYRGSRTVHPTGKRVWLQAHIQAALAAIALGKVNQGISELDDFIRRHPHDILALEAARYRHRLLQRKLLARAKSPTIAKRSLRQPQKSSPPPSSTLSRAPTSPAIKQPAPIVAHCGPAALFYACRLLGIETTEAELAKLSKADTKTGTTLLALKKAAEKKGLVTRALRMSNVSRLADMSPPLIAHFVDHHFVTIVSVSHQTLEVYDPAVGNLSLPIAEFGRRWDGYILALQHAARPSRRCS